MHIVSHPLVRRIEAAESSTLAEIVEHAGGASWTWRLAGGVALFRTARSPFTKLCGFGFAPLSDEELSAVERRYAEQRAPVQFELATYADPELTNRLHARGYLLSGYEEVLGHGLQCAEQPTTSGELEVRRAHTDERPACAQLLATAAMVPSEGRPTPAHDEFVQHDIEQAFRDMANEAGLQCWLAVRENTLVGGALMCVRDGIAQLFGAATSPAARRRGVQTALLATRLNAARVLDCELAVVTVQPGTHSHHNVQRAGFRPLYARAIWRREPSGS